ncbi:MAG: hypothetical protein NT075_27215, partial [Chloroflexi bacterium]|nr:hypothetical protein [Chloroflexota bacterium]
ASSPGQAQITSSQVYTTMTDLDGVFVFPAVELGTYSLAGVKGDQVFEFPEPLVISPGGSVEIPPVLVTPVNRSIYLPFVTK